MLYLYLTCFLFSCWTTQVTCVRSYVDLDEDLLSSPSRTHANSTLVSVPRIDPHVWGSDPASSSGDFFAGGTDWKYWLHEPSFVFIKMPNEPDMRLGDMWLAGTGTPAVAKGPLLAWTGRSSETYYCVMHHCEYFRDKGYHKCGTQQTTYKGLHGTGTCHDHVYVKDLCPTIAPSQRASPRTAAYCDDMVSPTWTPCTRSISPIFRPTDFCHEDYKGSCSMLDKSCRCPAGHCLAGNQCRDVSKQRGELTSARDKQWGIDVCINSDSAPGCSVGSTKGWIYQNTLRIMQWNPESRTAFQCDYAIFDCHTAKLLGFAWDRSIDCAWARIPTQIEGASVSAVQPELCPSIAYRDTNEMTKDTDLLGNNLRRVYVSFGTSLGYMQAQLVKTWGAGGPMRTDYDTCAAQKCDFGCVKENRTCTFKCCQNSLFISEYKDVKVLSAGHDQELTYADLCERSGYTVDPMQNLEEALALYEQKVSGMSLVTMKLMTTPPFNMIATVTPAMWLTFGVAVAGLDWISAHVSQTSFQIYIESFPLYYGHSFSLLKGKGIAITGEELKHMPTKRRGDPDRAPIGCRVLFGFVFVFLQSLVNNLAALVGTSLLNGALGINTPDAQGADVFGILGPVRDYIGQYVNHWLSGSDVGTFILSFFKGEIFGPLFGGVMWQIQNFLGQQPLSFLATKVIANLFQLLARTTGVCKAGSSSAPLNNITMRVMAEETTTFFSNTEETTLMVPGSAAQIKEREQLMAQVNEVKAAQNATQSGFIQSGEETRPTVLADMGEAGEAELAADSARENARLAEDRADPPTFFEWNHDRLEVSFYEWKADASDL